MLRALVNWVISRQERRLGAPLHYLRDLADTSVAAVAKIGLAAPIGSHRKYLPKETWHLARIAATHADDCGQCAQIAVNLAAQDGVAPDLLKLALIGDLDRLPLEHALAMRFAHDIAKGVDNEYLRARLTRIYGKAAFNELALAIATARLFPTLKRALGHAQSCSFVQVRAEKQDLVAA